MTLPIRGISTVIRRTALSDAPPNAAVDEHLVAVPFDRAADAERYVDELLRGGIGAADVAIIDPAAGAVDCSWLDFHDGAVALRTQTPRFDLLSQSDSGLHYVRERRGGLTRVLTPEELAEFDDPPPCPQCAEQFGCEHFNCAGEPLLGDAEVEAEVPREWLVFAKDNGVSREDLARLAKIVHDEEENEYRLRDGVTQPDMRLLELVLLLNDAQ